MAGRRAPARPVTLNGNSSRPPLEMTVRAPVSASILMIDVLPVSATRISPASIEAAWTTKGMRKLAAVAETAPKIGFLNSNSRYSGSKTSKGSRWI